MLLQFNKFLKLMKVFLLLPPAVCCSGWWRPASLPRSSWTWPFWTRRERLGYRQLSGWTQVVQWPIRNHIQSVQQWAFKHIWGKGVSWWKLISHCAGLAQATMIISLKNNKVQLSYHQKTFLRSYLDIFCFVKKWRETNIFFGGKKLRTWTFFSFEN